MSRHNMHMLNAAKLTADMIQRRDDMRRIMGDGYSEWVGVSRKVLVGLAREKSTDLTTTALALAKKLDSQRIDPTVVICALVDELESQVTP